MLSYMTGKYSNKKYSFFAVIFTAAGLLSLLLPLPLGARILLTVIYFVGLGATVGWKSLPQETALWRTLLGTLLHLSLTMVLGSLVYLLHDLSASSVFLVILVAPALTTLLTGRRRTEGLTIALAGEKPTEKKAKQRRWSKVMLTVIGALVAVALLALVAYGFGLLSGVATDLSIRSPWDNVPRLFFIVVFMIASGSFALSFGRFSGAPTLPLVMGLSALATTVAISVYSIGFGFDPFIHQATELHIFSFGEMLPKPPYYLGQYALVTMLARMVGGQVVNIDRWLVPFAFALSFPLAYWSLRRSFNWSSHTAAGATLGLLLLPLAPFVLTTPQGLADVFALLTVLTCLPMAVSKSVPNRYPAVLAAATAVIHPLAGVPLFLFVATLSYLDVSDGLLRRLPKLRWTIFIKLVLLTAVSLPLLFLLNSALSGTDVTLDREMLSAPAAIIEVLKAPDLVTRRFSAALDFVYGWRTSRTTALGLAGLTGLILLWLAGRRTDSRRKRETAIAFTAGAIAFLINFVLLRLWVQFPFLISYERTSYADRLADLTLIVLTPMLLYALGRLIIRIRRHGFPTMALGLTLLLAATVTANVYLAYPRRDRYEDSRGWSTSGADVQAVQSIDERADGADYVVLSDQSVSAAAIRELGFKRYFDSKDPNVSDQIFFYPIPTGGPLYQIFLKANMDFGRRATVLQALNLTGTDTAFYVVDHYWWQAQQIILNAQREADSWWTEDDRVWVFEYDRE
ncbi:hypothetical protein COY93_03740 [Candidatus Uhrbacteria bacterium CG_4_10_14_0_8_um_filter_58_22]|uniref:Glycosyltransferase RgtA/B/C/D-like domain-containing protein n=1 Tax=Candidatus Uhrbacteria bacterium CG_4_10_14_0_8_um_filter_58_22 TaxID=1975029 RepID=A0A2M7Q9A7_9BACT|nr:MAG: hypothetical protein AUJ19_00955 [Parcubacteria group bacterium CG1_02_58_44]PIY62160.1 MAG: hypothetical protein COY93_03740 [Candidatus Uhrbacteria bacterium CG_4_10_14_0_8_um_filter_58_22]